MPTGHANFTIAAASYRAGIAPDKLVTSNFIPVLIRGDRHIRCICTWGSHRMGEMYLRFYHSACMVKALGGHE